MIAITCEFASHAIKMRADHIDEMVRLYDRLFNVCQKLQMVCHSSICTICF